MLRGILVHALLLDRFMVNCDERRKLERAVVQAGKRHKDAQNAIALIGNGYEKFWLQCSDERAAYREHVQAAKDLKAHVAAHGCPKPAGARRWQWGFWR